MTFLTPALFSVVPPAEVIFYVSFLAAQLLSRLKILAEM